MKKALLIIGQVLLAVGVTLTLGGIASFFFEKVELRFLGNILVDEGSKKIWVFVNMILAGAGFFLLRSSKAQDSAK